MADQIDKFIIFRASFQYRDEVKITFSALPNPANGKQSLTIEAENADAAVTLAGTLLGAMGIKTHSALGDDLSISYYPDYFIGRIRAGARTKDEEYRITEFFPLREK